MNATKEISKMEHRYKSHLSQNASYRDLTQKVNRFCEVALCKKDKNPYKYPIANYSNAFKNKNMKSKYLISGH